MLSSNLPGQLKSNDTNNDEVVSSSETSSSDDDEEEEDTPKIGVTKMNADNVGISSADSSDSSSDDEGVSGSLGFSGRKSGLAHLSAMAKTLTSLSPPPD